MTVSGDTTAQQIAAADIRERFGRREIAVAGAAQLQSSVNSPAKSTELEEPLQSANP